MALSACINLVLCWCLPSSFCGFRKAVMLIIVCVSFWSSIWPSSEVIGNIFSKCKHCPPFLFAFFFPFKSHWEDWQDWIDFFLWQKLIIGLMILWPTSPCSAVADVPCGCGCAYAKVSLSGMSSSFSNAELHMAFCSVSWQHVLGTRFGGIPLIWAALLYRVRICPFCLAAWESSELNVYNQWLYGSYTVLSCICFREFMNPRQAGKLCCCFCSVRERTQHGRDLKSCLWGRAGGSAGRAISHGKAEMLTARCRTTWLCQILVCASESERKELRVRDGLLVWVHWEMLTGKLNPSFPLLSCVIRKPTAKKRHFEMPAPGCCGNGALTGDCVPGPVKSAHNKHAWNNSWLERTGLPSRNCMPLPCLLKEVSWFGSHKWSFFHDFRSRYCLTAKEGSRCCRGLLFICLDNEKLDSSLMMWLSVGSPPPGLFLDDSYGLCNGFWNCKQSSSHAGLC